MYLMDLKSDEQKLEVFHMFCERRILRYWYMSAARYIHVSENRVFDCIVRIV